MADIVVSAQNTLSFNNGAGSLPLSTYAAQSTITFTQVAHQNFIHVSAANQLSFSQGATLNRVVLLSAENIIGFSNSIQKQTDVSASNVLTFTQRATRNKYVSASNTLALSQGTPASLIVHWASSPLALSHLATFLKLLQKSASSTLALTHAASVYKANSLQPMIPIPVVPPFTPVVLTYGARVLTLKVPRFGNTDSIEVSRVQMNSRAGDLIIWAHPNWPKTETLKFSFVNLSNTQAKAFLAFLDETLGQDIILTDHEGNNWIGFITTPETPVVQQGREDRVSCGGFNCEFEFQGVPA